MDTAADIFATKGIEYLIVIGYLIVLVGVLWLLRDPAREVSGRLGRLVVGLCHQPAEYCFHQGHTWAFPGEKKIVKVGMDECTLRLLGPPTAIDLPEVGARLAQGENAWEVKLGSSSVGMLSPVDGEVVVVNDAVVDSPNILCGDCYDQGWLMKVRVPNYRRNQKNLMCESLARAWMEGKLRAWRDELGLDFPDRSSSAGCDGLLRTVEPEAFDKLAREMLLSED
jgi:glycine cleavage system H protein